MCLDVLQVWDTEELSSVTEVLSLRDVRVGAAAVLAPPRSPRRDHFKTVRPLLSLVDDDLTSDVPVRVISLSTGRFLEVSH
jgi:hypothetical protein